MKRKMTVYLGDPLAARLEEMASRPGMSRTAVVEAALGAFLSAETSDHVALSRRLNWMSRQLEQLGRDVRVVNETVALHARYHLTIAPALPRAEQQAACALGRERFEAFAAQVGSRVHMGMPLMRETMELVSTEKPELLFPDQRQDVPLGAPSDDADIAGVDIPRSKLAAAAAEGGSTSGFPDDPRRPSD